MMFSSFCVRSLRKKGQRGQEVSQRPDVPPALLQRARQDAHHVPQHSLLDDGRLVASLSVDERRKVARLLQLPEQLGVAKFFRDVDRPGHGADQLDCARGDNVSKLV